jgi:predicted amidophosphoribosyltransferase
MVYDPGIQIPDSPCVYLYGVNTGVMRHFDPDDIRPNLAIVRDEQEVQRALQKYANWKHAEAESFLIEEKSQLDERRADVKEAREKARLELEERARRHQEKMNIHFYNIDGNWDIGYALDLHTLQSIPIFDIDESGEEVCVGWDTTRSEVGEALYRLKYRGDRTQIEPLAETVAAFLRSLPTQDNNPINQVIKAIIPVPPSEARSFQPVIAVADLIGHKMGIPVPHDYLLKIKRTTALKGMNDLAQRHAELDGAFSVADQRFEGMKVLLFDDLFRSGETMGAITQVLKNDGKVGKVYVLALTVTRSRR